MAHSPIKYLHEILLFVTKHGDPIKFINWDVDHVCIYIEYVCEGVS